MFERFTEEAREVVVYAQEEARALRDPHIGTEHLLLGLLRQEGSPAAAVLVGHGVTRTSALEAVRTFTVTGLDAAALGTLGIDLDAVRDRVEATFGPGALDAAGARGRPEPKGHIPFTPRAKKVLELSLREAVALHSASIADGHLLLGLLREGEGLAAKVLADRGIDFGVLRQEVTATLRP